MSDTPRRGDLQATRRLGVVDVTHAHDNSSAIRLRKLIGADRASKMRPAQHPWGLGFGALKKVERSDDLTGDEASALSNLNLDARTLFQMEKSWRPYASRVAHELCNATKSESLIFELHTARVTCMGSAQKILWSSFREGEPDLSLKGPSVAIECKLLRSSEPKRLDTIARATEQHRDIKVPLVVSIGLSRELSNEEVREVVAELPNWKSWFVAHDRIAAAIVFSPRSVPAATLTGTDVTGTFFQFGSVTILRSAAAKRPLPDGFIFRGEDRRTEVGF
jgi:hypothetical protein